MKVVFMGLPVVGGNYSHFKRLKEGLEEHEVLLVSVGEYAGNLVSETSHVIIGGSLDRDRSKRELAVLLREFLALNQIDILIPMNSPIAVSIIPFLPNFCKVVQIVNSDTERVYKYCLHRVEYISKIICISPKQKSIIEKRLNFLELTKKIELIPHGVSVNNLVSRPVQDRILTIGYIGRIHDGHNAVMILPHILSKLDFSFRFELIGDGPDKLELLKHLVDFEITDHGQLSNDSINSVLIGWDIQLFTSKIGGFGLTLIECMNNEVVPIANLMQGITDYIITNGVNGYTVPLNDVNSYAKFLNYLNENREVLRDLQKSARRTVEDKFNLDEITHEYTCLFNSVLGEDKMTIPEDFANWSPYSEYKPPILLRLVKRFRMWMAN